jgi:hypothetical protein
VSSQPDRGDLSAIDGAVEVIFFDFDGTLTESPCHGFEGKEWPPGQGLAQKRASSGTRGDVWQQKARNMPCHICLAGKMSCFLFMIWTDPVMQ